MLRFVFACALFVLLMFCTTLEAKAFDPEPEPAKVVWIYRDYPQENQPDQRSDAERMFAPFGLMPAERTTQMTVDQQRLIDEKDASKGTCIEYYMEFKQRDDWLGSYTLVNGNAWGTKPGLNVQKLMGVGPETPLVLKFKAKGEGVVSFKMGGVRDGDFKSSVVFAREVRDSPTKLTAQFTDYAIGPIKARELNMLIDPFCVVASGLDNRGRDSVEVLVDDIRIELHVAPKQGTMLPDNWRQRLQDTLFVAYTPTGFVPRGMPGAQTPTANEIRADLKAIRSLADLADIPGNSVGIITYGCRDGLEQIPAIAHEANLNLSVIVGIFDPRDRVEIQNVKKLLSDKKLVNTIVGCCIGNEAITFRRANLEEIQAVAGELQKIRPIPLTTTEIVQAYGDQRLFSFDFSFVNAHAIFAGVFQPEPAAEWAIQRIDDLVEAAPANHLFLVKELGFPAAPAPHFSDEQQAQYWFKIFSSPSCKKVNVCLFDGLNNVDWKSEEIVLPGGEKANIGPHWPVLFQKDRTPKPHAAKLISLWKESRQ